MILAIHWAALDLFVSSKSGQFCGYAVDAKTKVTCTTSSSASGAEVTDCQADDFSEIYKSKLVFNQQSETLHIECSKNESPLWADDLAYCHDLLVDANTILQ